jgi:hypothetical protein
VGEAVGEVVGEVVGDVVPAGVAVGVVVTMGEGVPVIVDVGDGELLGEFKYDGTAIAPTKITTTMTIATIAIKSFFCIFTPLHLRVSQPLFIP